MYRQALAITPDHAQAKAALAEADRPPRPASRLRQDDRFSSRGGRTGEPPLVTDPSLGVYEFLLQDKSDLSRKAVALMNELQLTGHPRLIAFFGRRSTAPVPKRAKLLVAVCFLALALIPIGYVPTVRQHDGFVTPGLVMVVGLGVVGCVTLWYLVLCASTRYSLARARLTIERGVLSRNAQTTELWRVSKVELHQSILNRLTGDGTLVLTAQDANKPLVILLTGIQRISELRQTRERLLNLVFALRSNPMIKGIVQ